MNAFQKVQKMIDECKKYKHVDKMRVCEMFFTTLLKDMHEDPDFIDLVSKQLSLYCKGYLDPQSIYDCMNEPRHLIRNKMIIRRINNPITQSKTD